MKHIFLSFFIASSALAFEPNIVETETQSEPQLESVSEPIVHTEPFAESFTRSTAVIVEEIASSRFFLEFKPFKFNYKNTAYKTNLIVDSYRYMERNEEAFNIKMLPLDFKFGFENKNWGSFADIKIEDSTQESEFTVYRNGDLAKIGFGIILNFKNETSTTKILGEKIEDSTRESLEIAPFLFLAFKFMDNEFLEINQWNKIGSIFSRENAGAVEMTGLGVRFNLGLDFMFKVNSNVQVGLGAEFDFQAARFEIKDVPDAGASGVMIDFEIDLFKIRYTF